jgi:acetyl esterase
MQFSSCYLGNYKTWGRMIAARGVAVAMIDFRNSVHPSSAPEVAPFPAGLNDCVSGLKWVHAQADSLGIDPERIVVAGESGGGNLTLAVGMKLNQDGELGLIQGLYGMCPFIAGEWPLPQNPSSVENEGIFLFFQDNRSTMAYGIDAFRQRNPLAWPGMATPEDVRGLPPVVISVNECDPLRNWGGVHGTWFWVDPTYDIIVIGMIQQESAGNPMTGRPYPVPDIRAISRSLTYSALINPGF